MTIREGKSSAENWNVVPFQNMAVPCILCVADLLVSRMILFRRVNVILVRTFLQTAFEISGKSMFVEICSGPITAFFDTLGMLWSINYCSPLSKLSCTKFKQLIVFQTPMETAIKYRPSVKFQVFDFFDPEKRRAVNSNNLGPRCHIFCYDHVIEQKMFFATETVLKAKSNKMKPELISAEIQTYSCLKQPAALLPSKCQSIVSHFDRTLFFPMIPLHSVQLKLERVSLRKLVPSQDS